MATKVKKLLKIFSQTINWIVLLFCRYAPLIECYRIPLPFPKQQNLDSSKLKKFADNCKFDENGRTLSKQVENTVGKGEIAAYEQFLLFPQCFQKPCTADT